jgi:hypothetical protein
LVTRARVGTGVLAFVAAGCSIDGRAVSVGGFAGGADAGDAAAETVQLPVCKGMPLKAALITDLSEAFAGTDRMDRPDIEFGSNPDELRGGSFTYAAPFLEAPTLSLEPRGDGQALRVLASPGAPVDSGDAWVGLGFGLTYGEGGCLDATGYSGVQFSIDGSLGTCQLRFGVQFSQDDKVEDNPSGGSCALGPQCFPPLSGPLVPGADGIVMVPFAEVSGGSPTKTIDATTITGVNWQLVSPLTGDPCMASFTLDDVTFF